jgi:hypothetical protein
MKRWAGGGIIRHIFEVYFKDAALRGAQHQADSRSPTIDIYLPLMYLDVKVNRVVKD